MQPRATSPAEMMCQVMETKRVCMFRLRYSIGRCCSAYVATLPGRSLCFCCSSGLVTCLCLAGGLRSANRGLSLHGLAYVKPFFSKKGGQWGPVLSQIGGAIPDPPPLHSLRQQDAPSQRAVYGCCSAEGCQIINSELLCGHFTLFHFSPLLL
jgi:hypothetical protein